MRATAPEVLSDDLSAMLREHQGSALWLGRFDESEIWRGLEKCGFVEGLRARHLQPATIVIEPLDPFVQALKLFHAEPAPEHLLAEFRLREKTLGPDVVGRELWSEDHPRVLAIEWLVLQNPLAAFTPERPVLPGQRYPGLGQAVRILQWLTGLARELHLEGLVNHPEYFHNAYLYRDHFRFFAPEQEGLLHALTRDVLRASLAETSWGLELGCARDAAGAVFVWEAQMQVLPLSKRITEYFDTEEYRARVEQVCAHLRFYWDEEQLRHAYPAISPGRHE